VKVGVVGLGEEEDVGTKKFQESKSGRGFLQNRSGTPNQCLAGHCSLHGHHTSCSENEGEMGVGSTSVWEHRLLCACIFSLTIGTEPHLQILAK